MLENKALNMFFIKKSTTESEGNKLFCVFKQIKRNKNLIPLKREIGPPFTSALGQLLPYSDVGTVTILNN